MNDKVYALDKVQLHTYTFMHCHLYSSKLYYLFL